MNNSNRLPLRIANNIENIPINSETNLEKLSSSHIKFIFKGLQKSWTIKTDVALTYESAVDITIAIIPANVNPLSPT